MDPQQTLQNRSIPAWPFHLLASVASLFNAICWAGAAAKLVRGALRDSHQLYENGGLIATPFIFTGTVLSFVVPVWLMRRKKLGYALGFAGGAFVVLLTGVWLLVHVYI